MFPVRNKDGAVVQERSYRLTDHSNPESTPTHINILLTFLESGEAVRQRLGGAPHEGPGVMLLQVYSATRTIFQEHFRTPHTSAFTHAVKICVFLLEDQYEVKWESDELYLCRRLYSAWRIFFMGGHNGRPSP